MVQRSNKRKLDHTIPGPVADSTLAKVVLKQPEHEKRSIREYVELEAQGETVTHAEKLVTEQVDAGCCGMAGAFGYEKEHYDISMAIGERRLFPAVRSASEARIAITGVSCRNQVQDGTGRRPEHVAEILRGALDMGRAPANAEARIP